MASSRAILLAAAVAIVVAVVAPAVHAGNVITVTWKFDFDYELWAKNQMFNAGDTLVFNYGPEEHNVLNVVTKEKLEQCDTSSPLQTLNSGYDKFVLKAGENYFICGFPGHKCIRP